MNLYGFSVVQFHNKSQNYSKHTQEITDIKLASKMDF